MIWVHRYELQPRRALSSRAVPGARRGALIRVDDGFADIHPWPELGDLPLEGQLELLARGETTPLTTRSLAFAALDAAARRREVNLFEGLHVPESHWPGPNPAPGFDTVKLKSVDHIPDGVRLRVDFNNTLTPEEFIKVSRSLPRDRVDFIEDPTPYSAEVWSDLQRRTGLRLALDRGTAVEGVDVLVVKPALQEVPISPKEIVVTSYMDHPVGQLFAAWVAAGCSTSSRCGLVTHVLYESNAFSDRLGLDGSRLVPPPGNGIGFDDLLARLEWQRLS